MILLAPFSAWRFQGFGLLGLLAFIGAISIYIDPKDMTLFWGTFKMISLYAAASAPSWLLMRWAGYRLIRGKAPATAT